MLRAYRATGADLPFGDPLRAHSVAMEGYFWRLTDAGSGRALIALIGVNRGPAGRWATLGLASVGGSGPTLALRAADGAWADPSVVGARSGTAFVGDARRVQVDLGEGARLDVALSETVPWPRRALGGSSVFQMVPALNQYWHPWLLGGRADGWAELGGERWEIRGARVYAEKNWGREGFPESWWWGQAHDFTTARGRPSSVSVAFAGGQVTAGPLSTEVTALVVRLPDGRVVRLGDPLLSPVRAEVTEDEWRLTGRGFGWEISVHGRSPLRDAHVLPVPLPSEGRNTPGALEHLDGVMDVKVRLRGRTVWEGRSTLAALEHGSLTLAESELLRRVGERGQAGALPGV